MESKKDKIVEPFLYMGGDVGVLLIHGFTGSTSEMRPLGEHLARNGFTVKAPLLAGHGTCVQDMEKTGWRDWVASAKEAYDELKAVCSTIVISGLSMGGTIALLLAKRNPCAAVVTMCAPIFLQDRLAFFATPYSFVKRYLVKESTYPDHVMKYMTGYKETPLRCVGDLRKLVRMSRHELPGITAPALLMQGEQDKTVRPESASYIYKHIGSEDKEIRMYPKSGHILCVDADNIQVFHDFTAFIRKHTANNQSMLNGVKP